MGRMVLFLLGLLIVLVIHIWEGGTLKMLLHPGAALLCVLCPFLLGVVVYRADLLHALQVACGRAPSPAGGVGRQMQVLSGLRMLCITQGGLGFLVGVIGTVGTITKPELMGSWVALTLLSMVYTVTLAELTLAPLIDRLAISGLGSPDAAPDGLASDWRRAGLADLLVLLTAGGTLLLVAALAGTVTHFIQPAAVLIILAYAPLNASFHGIGGHLQAFNANISHAHCTARQQAQQQLVLLSARTLIYGLGSLGMTIGAIHICSALEDPIKVGAGLAVALCAPLISVFVAELFVAPRIHRLQADLANNHGGAEQIFEAANQGRAPLRQAVVVSSATVLALVLVLFAVSLA
tara:strand:- start:522 stop:1571 length:1050 start_codon:yes stop_codon:yes gene_type:complete